MCVIHLCVIHLCVPAGRGPQDFCGHLPCVLRLTLQGGCVGGCCVRVGGGVGGVGARQPAAALPSASNWATVLPCVSELLLSVCPTRVSCRSCTHHAQNAHKFLLPLLLPLPLPRRWPFTRFTAARPCCSADASSIADTSPHPVFPCPPPDPLQVWIFIGLNKEDPAAAVTLKQMDRH